MPELYKMPAVRRWVDPETGLPERVFVEFMQRLWDRAGGVSSFTNVDLTALASGQKTDDAVKNSQDIRTLSLLVHQAKTIADLRDELEALRSLVLSRPATHQQALEVGLMALGGVKNPIPRLTGYGTPTGTATRTAFDTTTVTTEQLAERVKALIDDLTR